MATTDSIHSTTQQFLDIFDIANNLVVLKDGTTSLIITVDAMNFGLLAEEEQDSIMYAYAGLLNSLNYPIQIIIKSQTKDVTGYLKLLKEQEDATFDRTQQTRIMKYRQFVSNLIRERNVLDKKFYVAIPAKPIELGLLPVSSVIPGKAQTDISTVDKNMVLEKARNILEPKRDHLIAQFARIGLYSRQLETQEIIQMFYQSYNPEAFEGQKMDDSRSYTAPLVSASIEDSSMDIQNPQQVTPVQAQPEQTAHSSNQVDPNQQAQTPPTPVVAATDNMEVPPTMQMNTPTDLTPPDISAPAASVPQQQSTGYSPTQMQNETAAPVASVPQNIPQPENTVSAPVTPGVLPTMPAPAPVVPAPEITPNPVSIPTPAPALVVPNTTDKPITPPAPELPKIMPGETDKNVPQETEIQIEHTGQMAQSEAVTSDLTQNAQPNSQTQPMPPLPEIK